MSSPAADSNMRLNFPAHIPFIEALGVTLAQYGDGQAELRLDLRPDHENSLGMAHGGVVMTLLDVAMAQACRSANNGIGVITIEMKSQFFSPSRGALVARGRMMHRTTRMAFAEAELLDALGQRCAHATGTFRYVQQPGSD